DRAPGYPVVQSSDDVRLLELRNYLPWQLLRDTDVMSMASSLEVRVPLLDDDVLRTVLAHPTRGCGKEALITATDTALLPLLRRPKRTFSLPFESWMRGPLA